MVSLVFVFAVHSKALGWDPSSKGHVRRPSAGVLAARQIISLINQSKPSGQFDEQAGHLTNKLEMAGPSSVGSLRAEIQTPTSPLKRLKNSRRHETNSIGAEIGGEEASGLGLPNRLV